MKREANQQFAFFQGFPSKLHVEIWGASMEMCLARHVLAIGFLH